MTHSIRILGLVAVSLLTQFCATRTPFVVDANQRARVVTLMGEQAAVDLELVYGAVREHAALSEAQKAARHDPMNAAACVENALVGTRESRAGKAIEASNAFYKCAASCSAEAKVAESPFKAIGERYLTVCEAPAKEKRAEELAQRCEHAVKRVETSNSLDAVWAVSAVRDVLKQSDDELGADYPKLDDCRRRLTQAEAARSAELQQAGGFLSRPDVIKLQEQIDQSQERIKDLRAMGRTADADVEAMNLRTLERRYSQLRRDAAK